jgi:hypothetical protein
MRRSRRDAALPSQVQCVEWEENPGEAHAARVLQSPVTPDTQARQLPTGGHHGEGRKDWPSSIMPLGD